jgi:hypothetical protein
MAWLTGWGYRKSITLSRASGAVTNYQMKLLLGESSGASGEDVDCGGLCASDFDDIRFTMSDGDTLLDYWIESLSGATPNQLATIWIEFDSIGTGATTFYMYYGKADATAVSNGANTFIVFDDFERGVNGDTIGGSWTEVKPHVHISTENWYGGSLGSRSAKCVGGATEQHASIPVTSGNIAIQHRLYLDHNFAQVYFLHGDASKVAYIYGNRGTNNFYYYDTSAHAITATIPSTWCLFETRNFNFTAGTYDVVIDGSVVKSGASMSVPSTVQDKYVYLGLGAAGQNVFIDNLIVRQFLTTEPAWGSWQSQEEEEAGEGWTHKILGIIPSKIMEVLVANISKILNT